MWPFKKPDPLTESEIAALDLRFEDKTPGGIIELSEREASFVFRSGTYKKSTPIRPYQVGWWYAHNQSTALKILCKE